MQSSDLDHEKADPGFPHGREITICGQDGNPVAECVCRDQEVQRFDDRSPATEDEAELSGFFPETYGLLEQVTSREQRQHALSFGSRANASPKLRDDRTAQRDLVGVE